jgi:hypothetical protein
MKECEEQKHHISNKLHMIYISSNNVRYPVTKTFTTLHPTLLNSTSIHFTSCHLNFTQLHFTTLSFSLQLVYLSDTNWIANFTGE